MKSKIAVIGGGASGLVAAIAAARNGADVTIFEKLNKVGKKILATGNGRCNYTNRNMGLSFYHGKNVSASKRVFDSFNLDMTISFFEDLGIYPYTDESGKVYPYSLQASSVLDVLRYEANRLMVKEITDFNVEELRKNKDKFAIIGNNETYYADKVILCCGGKASPQLGTDGSGYRLAEAFNHNLIEPFPALVQLKLKSSFLKKISGVKIEGKASAISENNIVREETGEILFTDYGISGPPILQISRMILFKMNKGDKAYISIDMFPDFNANMLYELLNERFKKVREKNIEDSLIGLINKKLIIIILNEARFEYKDKKCAKLNKKEIYKLVDILKKWKFEIIGHNVWQQAQSTAGGIDLNEVYEETLESKKTNGLYLAGEILDIDGDCGGYNLQWAWSSGYVAGYNASI